MKNLIFLLLLTLTACSSGISVKVSILDRDRLKKLPQFILHEAEAMHVRIRGNILNDAYNKWRGEIKKSVITAINAQVTAGTVTQGDASTFITAIHKSVDDAFTAAISSFNAGILEYDKIAAETDDKKKIEDASKAITLFASGDGTISTLFSKLQNEDVGDVTIAVAQTEVETATVVLLQQDQLLNDPLASFVVHAPKSLWKSYKISGNGEVKSANKIGTNRYGKTVARTRFGNSDIALSMEGPGHYTVKGVRMDAAEVIEASFKVLTQSIQFVAASTGLPVTPAGSGSSAGEPKPVIDEIAKLDELNSSMEIRKTLYNKSNLGLLEVILNEQSKLANNTNRPISIDIIQKYFETQVKQFNNTKPK